MSSSVRRAQARLFFRDDRSCSAGRWRSAVRGSASDPMSKEIEIKFRVTMFANLRDGCGRRGSGKSLAGLTKATLCMTFPDSLCENVANCCVCASTGRSWLLTHKGKGTVTRHKTRVETETKIDDGEQLEKILRRAGLSSLPSATRNFVRSGATARATSLWMKHPSASLARLKGRLAGLTRPRAAWESTASHTSQIAMLSSFLPGSGEPEAARTR